eukprot:8610629-Pyramimonas_sp.AAC.2
MPPGPSWTLIGPSYWALLFLFFFLWLCLPIIRGSLRREPLPVEPALHRSTVAGIALEHSTEQPDTR